MRLKNCHRIILTTLFSIIISCTFAQSNKSETGVASFYHDKFVGRLTANGEIFSQDKFTAAHKTLPLGTWVKVTNLTNDSVVIVRINDRMPLWNKRSIDLTEAAAGELNYISSGLTKVLVEIIPNPTKKLKIRETETATLPIEPIKVRRINYNYNIEFALASIAMLIDWEVYAANAIIKRKGSIK